MNLKKNIAVSDSGFIFNPDTGESFTASDKDTIEKDYHDFINMLNQFSLIEHEG